MAKVKELAFSISPENLNKIITVFKDLSSISEKALMRVDQKNILFYGLVGEGKSINAFKSYIFKINDLLAINDIPDTINLIIRDTKLFWRNLQTVMEFNTPVDCTMSYDDFGDMMICDKFAVKSKKIKLSFIGGDPMIFNTKITLKQIKTLTDTSNANFSFVFKSDDFANVKRLSVTDKDNDVFYINTVVENDNCFVNIGESSWDMNLAEINYDENKTMAFPKKFFKTIGTAVDSTVYIFDTYLVVSNENSDLLISSEITV